MRKFLKLFTALMTAPERRQVVILVFAYCVVGFFETAGVASISPFMAVLVDPDGAREGRLLGILYRIIEPSSNKEFVIVVGICVMIFIVVSNLLTALVYWLASRFVLGQQHRIAQRLLASYLHQNYADFLRRNTTDLIKTLFLTNNQVIAGMLLPAVQAFGRAVVAVMIVALLSVIDPVLSLSVGATIAGAYVLIYSKSRGFLLRAGDALAEADRERSKIAGEALNGLREVRMYNAENLYQERFRTTSGLYAKAQTAGEMVATLPRNALEVIAFACLLSVAIYLFNKFGNDANQALPVVALYGFAAYRLMGAVQIVFNGIARIRFNSAALEILANELREVSNSIPASFIGACPLPMTRSIEVVGLEFGYEPDKPILKGINVVIPAGTTLGIVGASGSGKSTFVDILLGFLKADTGTILIDGVDLNSGNARDWRASIGYVSQSTFLLDGTVAENIAFGVPVSEIQMDAVRRAASRAHIDCFVDELDRGYETIVGERGARLSGGQRQRIAIARALYRDPPIIVLDEATNALDNATEAKVSEAVHDLRGDKTLIMIAHRLSTIRECDSILVFKEGKIVGQGSYDDLQEKNESFRALTQGAERDGTV